MVHELALGSVLIVVSLMLAGLTYLWIESFINNTYTWLRKPPYLLKWLVLLSTVSLSILTQVTISVWIWAGAMLSLGLFETVEKAVYFALTCFTTLGFGDVLLPQGWRLLGGMMATNGMINFGFTVAVMVETMRVIRRSQIEAREPRLES